MANPQPLIKFHAALGKVETNAAKRAKRATDHTAEHEQKRDTQRSVKAASRHATVNAH